MRLPVSSVAMRQGGSEYGSSYDGSGYGCTSVVMMVVINDNHTGRSSNDNGGRRRNVDGRRRGDDDRGCHYDGRRRSNYHWGRSIHNGMREVMEADLVYSDISSDVEGCDVMRIASVMEMSHMHSIHMDREVTGVILDLEMEMTSDAERKRESLLTVPVSLMEVVHDDCVLLESDIHVHQRSMGCQKFDGESMVMSHVRHSIHFNLGSLAHTVHEGSGHRNHRMFDHHG